MIVLDASALLALLRGEPGGARVGTAVGEAVLSSVNFAEVLTRLIDLGASVGSLESDLSAAGVRIVEFGAADAEIAAALRTESWARGLSLGDRACLATAVRSHDAVVLTADRAWGAVQLDGVRIVLIR